MEWNRDEWVGNWENFECYFDDPQTPMVKTWEEAEAAVKKQKNPVSMMLFRHGAKRFWMDACYTVNEENPVRLGGWRIAAAGEKGITVDWLDEAGKSLGCFEYVPSDRMEKGLEGKPCIILEAVSAPEGNPFRWLLSMAPMPERSAKESGGLISHLHFQFASKKEELVKTNGRLRHPHWYATMCDAEATLLQRCNIVRAMHKLEIWEKT